MHDEQRARASSSHSSRGHEEEGVGRVESHAHGAAGEAEEDDGEEQLARPPRACSAEARAMASGGAVAVCEHKQDAGSEAELLLDGQRPGVRKRVEALLVRLVQNELVGLGSLGVRDGVGKSRDCRRARKRRLRPRTGPPSSIVSRSATQWRPKGREQIVGRADVASMPVSRWALTAGWIGRMSMQRPMRSCTVYPRAPARALSRLRRRA